VTGLFAVPYSGPCPNVGILRSGDGPYFTASTEPTKPTLGENFP
jgi:hypothetical protein